MADVQQEESEDRPLIELFVKAGADHMKNGGCPMCHRYFLFFYILREHGLIDLVVTTFRPHDLPPEVKQFSSAKQFPLVKVHRGVDANGVSMVDHTCDTVVDIEALLDRFECEDAANAKQSATEARAEKIFEDLYRKFKAFLKDQISSKPVIAILEKIDSYLKENGTKFLLKDCLTRADCYLLPTLQHLRVAGKFYKNFEIPTEYECLWAYLDNAYSTEAMHQSTPADREIIIHYEGQTAGPKKTHARLMKDERTFSVPSAAVLRNGDGNSAAGDSQRNSVASSAEPEAPAAVDEQGDASTSSSPPPPASEDDSAPQADSNEPTGSDNENAEEARNGSGDEKD